MFDPDHPGPDYTLRWPRELFAREARARLQQDRIDADWCNAAELLLEEAFVSAEPRDQLQAAAVPMEAGTTAANLVAMLRVSPQYRLLSQLTGAASRLPEEKAPRPYYTARRTAVINPDTRIP